MIFAYFIENGAVTGGGLKQTTYRFVIDSQALIRKTKSPAALGGRTP
jgi:hypothetical protein